MSRVIIEMMVKRWSDPAARPLFKGRLIDADGCCCAQGDVLRVCGWSDALLRSVEQADADDAVAKALDISRAHAILLRRINDQRDGCPQDVLAHPERILGHQAHRVLTFWRHLDELTPERWGAVAAAATSAWDTVWDAAAAAAAWDAAGDAAWDAAGDAAGDAAAVAAGNATGDPAGDAAWDAAAARFAAEAATNEIQGADRLKSFVFLPMFGISRPEELDKQR